MVITLKMLKILGLEIISLFICVFECVIQDGMV